MPSTIKDIAKDTGLSLATISKFLNGKPISKENKIIIEKSIEKLGYVPNKAAQALRSKKTKTICILLPKAGDYFWGQVCTYIEEYLQDYHYSVMVRAYSDQPVDFVKERDSILNTSMDGIIIIPYSAKAIPLFNAIEESNIPFVFLDQEVYGIEADVVTSNNCEAAYRATKYLLEKGHRRIGVIVGELFLSTLQKRVDGFNKACDEYGISEADRIVMGGEFKMEMGLKLFGKMMRLRERPTAVFFLGHDLTLGAIMEASELRLKIPEDISVISFDDDEIFHAFFPPITAIAQNYRRIGRETVELIMKRIGGDRETYPERKEIDAVFLERESVKNLDT
ncbi:MAG TPA: LacI family transcriptional regulator [Clostridiales bacterium]|nr:LacI family transcriptional regulator [Clostridiales bacterium]